MKSFGIRWTLGGLAGSFLPAHMSTDTTPHPRESRSLPSFPLEMREWGERLVVPEWDIDEHESYSECTQEPSTSSLNAEPMSYRIQNGWKGTDFMHSKQSPVQITDYHCRYGPGTDITISPMLTIATTTIRNGTPSVNTFKTGSETAEATQSPLRGGAGTVLTGRVHFKASAESHAGYCHGGTMCSVIDDAVGWVAFCVTGTVRPWTGFTVQINTSLLKPVLVHSSLLVQATITQVERRKVMVSAKLYQTIDDNGGNKTVVVHATCEGVVVLNKGVLVIDEVHHTGSLGFRVTQTRCERPGRVNELPKI